MVRFMFVSIFSAILFMVLDFFGAVDFIEDFTLGKIFRRDKNEDSESK